MNKPRKEEDGRKRIILKFVRKERNSRVGGKESHRPATKGRRKYLRGIRRRDWDNIDAIDEGRDVSQGSGCDRRLFQRRDGIGLFLDRSDARSNSDQVLAQNAENEEWAGGR